MCRWPLDYCPHVALPERVDCAERHAAVSVHTHINRYRLTAQEGRCSSAQTTTRGLDRSPAPANTSAYDAVDRRVQVGARNGSGPPSRKQTGPVFHWRNEETTMEDGPGLTSGSWQGQIEDTDPAGVHILRPGCHMVSPKRIAPPNTFYIQTEKLKLI